MSYSEEVTHYKGEHIMFKNHKLELKLVKDNQTNGLVDATPSVTKEDVIHISKTVVKYLAGAALIVLASSAVIDTAQYAAMTKIDNNRKKSED
jgi:hypothetical protein